MVESFAPHIVLLKLGTNDLFHLDSLVTASAIEDLVGILYNEHSVQQISVCQTLNRKNDAAFNARVKALKKYLKVLLTPIPWCFLGGHRGFWNTSQRYFTRDAVHLNKLGHYKYDQSLRGGGPFKVFAFLGMFCRTAQLVFFTSPFPIYLSGFYFICMFVCLQLTSYECKIHFDRLYIIMDVSNVFIVLSMYYCCCVVEMGVFFRNYL